MRINTILTYTVKGEAISRTEQGGVASMNSNPWVWLPVAAISSSAYAATYFTTEQAQQALFPGKAMTAAFVTLSDAQANRIANTTGVKVLRREITAWKVAGGGLFVLDEVVGKHEFITYAVGIDANGAVVGVEIISYRESYGYEVRNTDWRAQFIGKTEADSLQLGRDIRNISGATLSSKHLTDGIKRVLATYAIAFR
jgi:Na+-translocating ferredoxin:NAD+ oxidoreductase RnfG subunit